MLKKYLFGALAAFCLLQQAVAAPLKVAVTDLAYEEKLERYIRVVVASSSQSLHANTRTLSASSQQDYLEVERNEVYIERGELRKFTADVRGEMLKSGEFSLFQARPYPQKDNEKLFDIVKRIKQGQFAGADYVLFGTLSDLQSREEANMINGSGRGLSGLNLELAADFSLISTRDYQVVASFSAQGHGDDLRIVSANTGTLVHNRAKVVADASKTLGKDVIRQLLEQLGKPVPPALIDGEHYTPGFDTRPVKANEVTVLR